MCIISGRTNILPFSHVRCKLVCNKNTWNKCLLQHETLLVCRFCSGLNMNAHKTLSVIRSSLSTNNLSFAPLLLKQNKKVIDLGNFFTRVLETIFVCSIDWNRSKSLGELWLLWEHEPYTKLSQNLNKMLLTRDPSSTNRFHCNSD